MFVLIGISEFHPCRVFLDSSPFGASMQQVSKQTNGVLNHGEISLVLKDSQCASRHDAAEPPLDPYGGEIMLLIKPSFVHVIAAPMEKVRKFVEPVRPHLACNVVREGVDELVKTFLFVELVDVHCCCSLLLASPSKNAKWCVHG